MGTKTGNSSVNRGKIGHKKSVIFDGRGIPSSVAVSPTRKHDSTTIDEVLDNVIVGDIPNWSYIVRG